MPVFLNCPLDDSTILSAFTTIVFVEFDTDVAPAPTPAEIHFAIYLPADVSLLEACVIGVTTLFMIFSPTPEIDSVDEAKSVNDPAMFFNPDETVSKPTLERLAIDEDILLNPETEAEISPTPLKALKPPAMDFNLSPKPSGILTPFHLLTESAKSPKGPVTELKDQPPRNAKLNDNTASERPCILSFSPSGILTSFHFETASAKSPKGPMISLIDHPPRKAKENALTPSANPVNCELRFSGTKILPHFATESAISPNGLATAEIASAPQPLKLKLPIP